MTSLTLPHPREDVKIIVKGAFEDTPGIKTYYDDGLRIIGKTGPRVGLIKSSYGEQVIVEIPDNQPSETETMITVVGKREISTNIGSDPEKYVSQFLQKLNEISHNDINVILEVLGEEKIQTKSKEVKTTNEQANGEWLLILVSLLLFFVFIMPILMI